MCRAGTIALPPPALPASGFGRGGNADIRAPGEPCLPGVQAPRWHWARGDPPIRSTTPGHRRTLPRLALPPARTESRRYDERRNLRTSKRVDTAGRFFPPLRRNLQPAPCRRHLPSPGLTRAKLRYHGDLTARLRAA